jgi:hypothetical protein
MKRTGSDSILIDKKNHMNEFRSFKYKVHNKYDIKNSNFKHKCYRCKKLTFIDNKQCDNCNNFMFVKQFFNIVNMLTASLFCMFTFCLPFYILPAIFNHQILQSYLYLSNTFSGVMLSVIWVYYMYYLNDIATIMSMCNAYLLRLLIIPFKSNLSMKDIDKYIY